MTSASGLAASTSGTGTAPASASQRRPFASAAKAAANSAAGSGAAARVGDHAPGRGARTVSRIGDHARRGSIAWIESRDGLGEGAAAAGQGHHEVLVAVLRADDPRFADGQAGQPREPVGHGGGTAHAGVPERPSSWASRAAMTGAAAPSRSST